MSRQRHSALLLVVLFVTLTACVKQNAPGVAVKKLQADIVFGVADPTEPAKPASFEAPSKEVLEEEADEFVLPPPASDSGARPIPKRSVPLLRAPDPCPPARIDAFPAVSATRQVENQPTAGVYRWKQSGQVTVQVNGQPMTFALSGFQERLLTDISPVSRTPNPTSTDPTNPANDTKTFTFSMLERIDGGLKRITYQVRTGTVGVRSEPGVEVPQPTLPTTPLGEPPTTSEPPDLPDAVVVGDPERGITVKKIEDLNEKGDVIRTSEFRPAVQVLPLQVIPDETFRSVGVADRSQFTLIHDGIVKSRNRVDACGEMVDGWEVEINQVMVDGDHQEQRKLVMFFATQYGGMPINEVFTYPNNQVAAYSLAKLTPLPLPAP